jgi:hypothetical protein
MGLGEILLDDRGDVRRTEGMEIERVLDRDVDEIAGVVGELATPGRLSFGGREDPGSGGRRRVLGPV